MFIEIAPEDNSKHYVFVYKNVAHVMTESKLKQCAKGDISQDDCTPEKMQLMAKFLLDRLGCRLVE